MTLSFSWDLNLLAVVNVDKSSIGYCHINDIFPPLLIYIFEYSYMYIWGGGYSKKKNFVIKEDKINFKNWIK